MVVIGEKTVSLFLSFLLFGRYTRCVASERRARSLTRQLFIRGGHRRPFAPTFSSLNINYSPESICAPALHSPPGRTHTGPLLRIYRRSCDSCRRLSWQLGNKVGNDRSRGNENGAFASRTSFATCEQRCVRENAAVATSRGRHVSQPRQIGQGECRMSWYALMINIELKR